MENLKETLSEVITNSFESLRKACSSLFSPSKLYRKEMLEKDFKIYNLYFMMLNELNNKNEEAIEKLEYEKDFDDTYWSKESIIRSYMYKLHKMNCYDDYLLVRDIFKKESEAYKEMMSDIQKEIKRCCDELEELKDDIEDTDDEVMEEYEEETEEESISVSVDSIE